MESIGMLIFYMMLLSTHTVMSHLCLIEPRQRGDMNIDEGGSGTCFRLDPPCGNLPPQDPRYLYFGGNTYFFKWQQNYNHYEVGYPGYMDIAVAPDVNSDNFTTLAVVMDRYEYAQDHQRNYTAVIIMANMNCEHCVLRARYNPHKPGETTFYQCSDISIKTDFKVSNFLNVPPTDKDFNQIRKAHELSQQYSHSNKYKLQSDQMNLYGFAYNPFESSVLHYVSIDVNTGSISMIKDFNFGFGSNENQFGYPLKFQRMSPKNLYKFHQSAVDYKFMLASVMSVNKDKGILGLILHETGGLDDPASTLMEITANDGNILRSTKIANFDGSAINALLYMNPDQYLTLSIESASGEGFYFVVGEINGMGVYKRLMSSGIEPLYVNFQFMEVYDDLLFLLMGNENAADVLNARIYIFNLTSMKFDHYVELNVSMYTYQAIQSANINGKKMLLAMTPGLTTAKYPEWNLIEVDPMTGQSSLKCPVFPSGIMDNYYGGVVFGGVDEKMAQLYYILRVADSYADVIVSIDLNSCHRKYSSLTSLSHVHNIALVMN